MAWKESCQAEGTAWKWQVRVPPPSLGWTGVRLVGLALWRGLESAEVSSGLGEGHLGRSRGAVPQ